MTLSFNDVLNRPRQCSADWLIIQAKDLGLVAKDSKNSTALIFACLETRNAIEQLWFEILMLIHSGSMSREMFERCRRRKDGFYAEIRETEPEYRKLFIFTSLVMKQDRKAPTRGIPWDLGKLKKAWQKLSGYCHAQAHPAATIENEDWFESGLLLVNDTYNYFEISMSNGSTALIQPERMTGNTRDIWEDFRIDKITEEQVATRLILIQPL